jgi:hypothetical protein
MPEERAVTRLATEVAESPQPQPSGILPKAGQRIAVILALYIVGGFFVTATMWVHPTGLRQSGDPQDVNQATWFLRYTATAIEHFRLPALSTMAMNAPHSVNLMWNTSLLLPGIVVTPVTALFGPQVGLTSLLVIGFAGSAASMYYVLRRWQASQVAAFLGGGLYGFSPALVDSGIGHYSLVLAILPPLIVDRVLRLVTASGTEPRQWRRVLRVIPVPGRDTALRNGIWIGLLVAAQLFVSEELLVDTVIATVILLVVLALCRPREVLSRIPPLLVGLVTGGVIALVLSARALWVQFHGVSAHAGATVVINYQGHRTNLGTLPYAFINPSSLVLLHTHATGRIANYYPQPLPEYLAYLGVPLIIVLLAAIAYFWNYLPIRVAGITCILLEWLGMGAEPIRSGTFTLPTWLLPWGGLQHLPLLDAMVPDRLCILADVGAAAVLAFSLDLARSGKVAPFSNWRNGSLIATGIAVIALLPIVPAPYGVTTTGSLPAGYAATFKALHLPSDARVLLAPFPYAGTSQVMRWQAETGYPATMIGGDFIKPDQPGRTGRAGRAGMTPTSYYIDYLYNPALGNPALPPQAQIQSDLASWKPNAVVAAVSPSSTLGKFLVGLFGQPDTRIGQVLGWKYKPGAGYGSG